MSNIFKKVTSASMAMLIVLSIVSPFSGVMAAYSTLESANKLAALGVIVDNSANPANYRLGDSITRGEMAKVTMKLSEEDVAETCAGKFSDLVAADWACKYAEAGLANGYFAANATFRPMDVVTKIESLKMIMKARGIEKSSNSDWMAAYVEAGVEAGVLEAAFTDYNTVAQRGWIFQTAVNAVEGMEDEGDDLLGDLLGDLDDEDTDTDTGTGDTTDEDTDVVVTGGDVEVSLSPETPKAQSIPRTAESVNFLTFDVTAGDEDTTISSVTLTRQGLGSKDDFDKIRLVRDGLTVSNDKTITSDDTVTLTTNIVIKAGATETFTVVAGMDSVGNTVNNFAVTAMTTDGGEVAGLPVVGYSMSTVDYTVAEVTITDKGTDSTIDVGSENTTIGEFKLTESEGASKKGVIIKAIRFKTSGGVDLEDNLANIALYENGTKVSTETVIDGDYVAFALDDLLLADGKSKTFVIKADITSGENGDVVTFSVKDSFDIYALEEGTGIGASVDKTTGILADYTLNAGKVTISQDTSTPSNEDYVKDTDDVLVFVAKVDTDQEVTVDAVRLFVHADTTDYTKANHEARYENIKLVVNDTVIDTTDTVVDGGAANIGDGSDYYDFDSSVTLKDNDLIKVYVDITKDALPSDVLKVFLNNAGTSAGSSASFLDVEYLSDGETVPQNKLSGTANSNKLTVVNSSDGVTIVRNDGYANGEVFLAGEQGAVLLKGVINSGNSSALEVKKMNFDLNVTNSSYTNYTNFKLLINGTQYGTSEDFTETTSPDGSLTIEDINFSIAKNSQATFELVGNIDTSTVADNAVVTLDVSDSLFYDDADDEIVVAGGDVTSATLALNENAKLTIAVDGDTPDSAIVVADTTNVEIAKYKFTAKDGDVSIKDLYFAGVNDDSRISSLRLVVNGSPVDTRTPSAGRVHFVMGSTNELVIAKNESVVISVKADFNKITSDSQTNKTVALSLTDMEAETDATGKALTKVENAETNAGADLNAIVTLDTGDHFTTSEVALDLDIDADTMYIRKTQPTLATQSLSSTKLSNGEQTLYKVAVSADSKADVEVVRLVFDVTTNLVDADLATFKLFVNGTEETDATCLETVANDTITCTLSATNDVVVSAGSSKTFELKATAANVVDNDYVTVSILEDAAALSAGAENRSDALADANGIFLWTDTSGSPHSATTVDFFNGFKVNGLTTTTTTLEN